jgi:hypothetical protein
MKVVNLAVGALIAVTGYLATMPIASTAKAEGFSESCVPAGSGVVHCVVHFCTTQLQGYEGINVCFMVDEYDRFQPEQIINQ